MVYLFEVDQVVPVAAEYVNDHPFIVTGALLRLNSSTYLFVYAAPLLPPFT